LVLVVLAVAFAVGHELYRFAAKKVLEARVRSAFPRVCGEIRSQRQQLIAAIQAYKADLGFYPPDHVLTLSRK